MSTNNNNNNNNNNKPSRMSRKQQPKDVSTALAERTSLPQRRTLLPGEDVPWLHVSVSMPRYSFAHNDWKPIICLLFHQYDKQIWGGKLQNHLLKHGIRIRIQMKMLTDTPTPTSSSSSSKWGNMLAVYGEGTVVSLIIDPAAIRRDPVAWTVRQLFPIAKQLRNEEEEEETQSKTKMMQLDLQQGIDLDEWQIIGQGGTGMICAHQTHPEWVIKIWRRAGNCHHWRQEYTMLGAMHSYITQRRDLCRLAPRIRVMRAYQFETSVEIKNLHRDYNDANNSQVMPPHNQCVMQVQRIYPPRGFGSETTQAMFGQPDINFVSDIRAVALRGRMLGLAQLDIIFGGRQGVLNIVAELGTMVAALQLDGCFDLTDAELTVGSSTQQHAQQPELFLIDFDMSRRYERKDYLKREQLLAANLCLALETVAYYPMKNTDSQLFEVFRGAYVEEGSRNGHGVLAQLVMQTYETNTDF